MKRFRAVSFLTNFEKEANVMNDVRFSDRSTSRCISFFYAAVGRFFAEGQVGYLSESKRVFKDIKSKLGESKDERPSLWRRCR